MLTAEPSYFDFLMKRRCLRRTRVPFAQAVGVVPERMPVARSHRPPRLRPVLPNGTNQVFGENIKPGL
jgi:hypothetical protein